MKKLLGLLMVMTMAWPVAANADVLKNVDVKGEIHTIVSDVHHADAYYNQAVRNRVLAGFSANLVEDVTANVLFQYYNAWDGAMRGDTITAFEGTTEFANANVVLSNLFDCFELTVGRQFYGDEDSAVMYIGPNHYNAEALGFVESIDAAKLTYADDVKALTLIAGKTIATPLKANGTTVYGADFRWGFAENMKLQTYIYDIRETDVLNPAGDVDDNAGLYGAKLTFNPEAFLLSAEYARNFGGDRLIKEHKDTGYLVKVDAALKAADAMTLRGAFVYTREGFMARGNYTPGLLIGHAFDVYNYSADGLRLFNVGVDYKPFEKWTFSLDGYSFQGREGHHTATYEADLTAKYQHNEYVQLFAGVGYAKYGTDVETNLGATYKDAFLKDNFKGQIGMLINF